MLAYISVWVVSHVYESNRENVQEALKNLAIKDPLTSVNNRLALQYLFEQEINAGGDLSIVLIDIDFFKKVNDEYGHEAGDLLLIELTRILVEQLNDQQVFRLGGDEFVLLIPESKERALQITEKIRQAAEKHIIKYKEKIDLYKEISQPIIELIVEIEHNQSIATESLKSFEIKRLMITAQLTMFAPDYVYHSYNKLIDYLYNSFEGTEEYSFVQFREIAMRFLSDIRKDIDDRWVRLHGLKV